MDKYIQQLAGDLKRQLQDKITSHKNEILDSEQFTKELKFLSNFSWDTIQTIRTISLYSTRAKHIYDEFLSIRSSDDLLQSIIGMRELINNGAHNLVKRELRYLIEMSVKYLVVDQEKHGEKISIKSQYLSDHIPNSSIEVIERLKTPFSSILDKEFKDEVKDIFYKNCAYVHPSKRQIEEQLENYSKGKNNGFETSKMLADINKLTFRTYDIILTLLFIGFGHSMSGELFIEIYDTDRLCCMAMWGSV